MANERLAAVEQLLCERYNVRALDGPLKDAIDADDVVGLRGLLEERELYQWRGAIFAALPGDEAAEEPTASNTEGDGDEKSLDEMTKSELQALAEERGVVVYASFTKAEIIEALTAE
jgi:hypothetical protein